MQSQRALNLTANLSQSPVKAYKEASPLRKVGGDIYQIDYFSNNRSLLDQQTDRVQPLVNGGSLSRQQLIKPNFESITKAAGNDIISNYNSSRNGAATLNVKAYTQNKVSELKAKQFEDEWAKIQRADFEKKTMIEQERKLSQLNQKKYLKDFLEMQVEEKKRKDEINKL